MAIVENVLLWLTELSWTTLILSMLIVILVNSYWIKQPWLHSHLPPGPPVMPFAGSGPALLVAGLGMDIRRGFSKLATYYGNVYTVYLFNRVVVLSGYDVIKEAMIKFGSTFAGRPDIFAVNIISNDGYGIIGTQGHFWQEQRRYVLHVLRNFGLGRNRMEELILEESTCLIRELDVKVGTIFNPRPYFAKAVSNVVSLLAFGERRQYDDPVMVNFMEVVAQVILQTGGPRWLNVYPWMRHIPGLSHLIGYNRLKNNLDHLHSHYKQWIDDHKKMVSQGEAPADLIGAYLVELQKRKHEVHSTFSEKALSSIINDLFLAGTDTTSTTLTWLILYMIIYPDVQTKIQTEIREVFGAKSVIRWEDRSKLPYTESAIAEIMRRSNVIPLMAPRATMDDVTFRGYHIPKGTMIIMNAYSIDMDPNLWDDPEQFKPDRFLDEHGTYKNREEQVTFGMGKRVCIGESLARIELFLFFVAIMQKFKFRTPPGGKIPNIEGINGATYQPLPFDVVLEYYT